MHFDQSLEIGLNITDSSVENVLKSPEIHFSVAYKVGDLLQTLSSKVGLGLLPLVPLGSGLHIRVFVFLFRIYQLNLKVIHHEGGSPASQYRSTVSTKHQSPWQFADSSRSPRGHWKH